MESNEWNYSDNKTMNIKYLNNKMYITLSDKYNLDKILEYIHIYFSKETIISYAEKIQIEFNIKYDNKIEFLSDAFDLYDNIIINVS